MIFFQFSLTIKAHAPRQPAIDRGQWRRLSRHICSRKRAYPCVRASIFRLASDHMDGERPLRGHKNIYPRVEADRRVRPGPDTIRITFPAYTYLYITVILAPPRLVFPRRAPSLTYNMCNFAAQNIELKHD